MRNNDVLKIVMAGSFIALVTVTTYIGIPWPFTAGGYMHLGTLTALIIAISYGKEYGAISGGIGMFIFDIFSPYAIWAPGTLVVRLLMGYFVGKIAYDSKTGEQGLSFARNLIAIVVGAVIMIIGYYLYEAIFLTDFRAAIFSISGNVVQFTLGLFALVIVPLIKKVELELKKG